ncbi:MAG TPA: pilus assembly protein, partial [Asticcacaulis sp.]|nr:pilus assembly protein [Asticcacaulis sp.]
NQSSVIAKPGLGTTPSSPQKVLFFVSDGMTDSYDCSVSGCRRIGGLDVPTCTAIKNRGIRIAVLYTTYLRLEGQYYNDWYDKNVDKYISPTNQVAANMQSCASPGLYFEVGPDEGISEAMTALFNKVVQVVRIQQ